MFGFGTEEECGGPRRRGPAGDVVEGEPGHSEEDHKRFAQEAPLLQLHV